MYQTQIGSITVYVILTIIFLIISIYISYLFLKEIKKEFPYNALLYLPFMVITSTVTLCLLTHTGKLVDNELNMRYQLKHNTCQVDK